MAKTKREPTQAERIVAAILTNLDDRSGFDWWWGDIDSATQREIKRTLAKIVAAELKKPTDQDPQP